MLSFYLFIEYFISRWGDSMTLSMLSWLFLILFVAIKLLLLLLLLIEMSTNSPYPLRLRAREETVFFDQYFRPFTFPSLADEPTKDLSVVVPVFNKQRKLTFMLDKCLEWLDNVNQFKYEVIVVSDSSIDGTFYVVSEYVRKYGPDKVRLLSLMENRGKGGALSLGMLSARGRNLLFADVDGASKIEDLQKLYSALSKLIKNSSVNSNELCAVVSGSHYHFESTFSTYIMTPIHIIFGIFGIQSVKDTDCGFKLFTRPAARIIFNNLHLERWGFDKEMLFIAEKLNMSIAEVAVNYADIQDSKKDTACSFLEKGFAVLELLAIWIKYRSGSWKLLNEKIN